MQYCKNANSHTCLRKLYENDNSCLFALHNDTRYVATTQAKIKINKKLRLADAQYFGTRTHAVPETQSVPLKFQPHFETKTSPIVENRGVGGGIDDSVPGMSPKQPLTGM